MVVRGLGARLGGGRAVLSTLGLLLIVRILAPQWMAGFEPAFPDSWSYIDAARPGPLSTEFWFGQRPPGMSIVVWLTDANPRVFVLFQTLLYVAAFVLLADRILRTVSSRVIGWALAVAVLAVAAQPRFALWNGDILSESLSISLGLFALLSWWKVVDREGMIGGATAWTIAWLTVRDVNVVPVALLAVVLVIAGGRKLVASRTVVKAGAVLLVLVVYSLVSQNVSERNQYGLMNNIGLRVLPDARVASNFEAMGMPVNDALKRQTGMNAWVADGMMYSPELSEFREWVHGPGQGVLVRSLVQDSQFWLGHLRDATQGAWNYPFLEYDRHGMTPRLVDPLPIVGGPRGNTEALVFLGLVALATVFLVRRQRRIEALFVGTIAAMVALEVVAGSLADGIEVQRHLVGSLSRVTVVPLLVVALLCRSRNEDSTRVVDVHGWMKPIVTSLGVVLVLAAVVVLEFRSQDWDPAFARTVVERVGRYGGTYYDNGIWHHGPLDAVMYDIARRVTSFDTYWFAIAALVVLIATVVAMSARAIASATGSARWLSAAFAAVILLHLTVSSSDYAGVIYSRNVSTALIAVGAAIAVSPGPWRSGGNSRRWFLAVAVLAGLAAQTMLSASVTAVVLLVFLVRTRGSSVSIRRPWITAAASGIGAVASAPLWYLARGSFHEFWQNWWVMGGYMNRATGLSLMQQLSKGRTVLVEYYGDRPLLLAATAISVASAFVTLDGDSPSRRSVRRYMVAWLAAGWLELVISQRYSSHYFVVIMVPTAMLFASTLVLIRSEPEQRVEATSGVSTPGFGGRTLWAVLVASVIVVTTQCVELTRSGLESLGRFRGFEAHADFVRDTRSGPSKNVRAILDLVSEDRGPLLAWTMFPWTYLEFERVPATRLSWKSFMLGEIYLARSSPEYVLDDTWSWFEEDLDESDPGVYLRPKDVPFVTDTPFAEKVRKEFRPSYEDPTFELQLRRDIAISVLGNREQPTAASDMPDQSGSVALGNACTAVTARVSSDGASAEFRVSANSGNQWYLSVGGGLARSGTGTAVIHERPVSVRSGSLIRIVSGPRSTALVVDDMIVAAVSHEGSDGAVLSWDPANTSLSVPTIANVDLPVDCQR